MSIKIANLRFENVYFSEAAIEGPVNSALLYNIQIKSCRLKSHLLDLIVNTQFLMKSLLFQDSALVPEY